MPNIRYRIVIVDGSKFDVGGVQKHLYDLLTNIDTSLFNVTYIRRSKNYVTDALENIPGVTVKIIPFTNPLNLVAIWNVAKCIKQSRAALIHSHTPAGGIVARIAALLIGNIKMLHTIHGPALDNMKDIPEFRTRYSAARRMKLNLKIALEKYLDNKSDCLIALSNDDAAYLTKHGHKPKLPIAVIPNGIDISTIHVVDEKQAVLRRLNINPDAFVIVSVGNLTEQKGFAYLIDAFSQIVDKLTNSMLLILGDGPLKDQLTKQCVDLGIEQATRFLGKRDDVFDILSVANIFVLASLWEGLPIALLEAMAMRNAIIVTAVNGCKEVIANGKNGILVPPQSPKEISAAIIKLYNDVGLSTFLGKEARRTVEIDYSLNAMVKSTTKLYIDLHGSIDVDIKHVEAGLN